MKSYYYSPLITNIMRILFFFLFLFLFLSIKQTGYLGLLGNRVDAIDFYTSNIERLAKEVSSTPSVLYCNFKILIGCFILFLTLPRRHIWYLYSTAYCSTSICCHLLGDLYNFLFSTSDMGLLEYLLSFFVFAILFHLTYLFLVRPSETKAVFLGFSQSTS